MRERKEVEEPVGMIGQNAPHFRVWHAGEPNRSLRGGGHAAAFMKQDREVAEPEDRPDEMDHGRLGNADGRRHLNDAIRESDKLPILLESGLDKRSRFSTLPRGA